MATRLVKVAKNPDGQKLVLKVAETEIDKLLPPHSHLVESRIGRG
jgi:hypothetical protein